MMFYHLHHVQGCKLLHTRNNRFPFGSAGNSITQSILPTTKWNHRRLENGREVVSEEKQTLENPRPEPDATDSNQPQGYQCYHRLRLQIWHFGAIRVPQKWDFLIDSIVLLWRWADFGGGLFGRPV